MYQLYATYMVWLNYMRDKHQYTHISNPTTLGTVNIRDYPLPKVTFNLPHTNWALEYDRSQDNLIFKMPEGDVRQSWALSFIRQNEYLILLSF